MGRVFGPLTRLIDIRKSHPVFGGGKTQFLETQNPAVLGYIHWRDFEGLLVLANFSEQPQTLEMAQFYIYGFKGSMYDLVGKESLNLGRSYTLEPYQFLWLMPK